MGELIQPVVDFLGLTCAVTVIPLVVIPLSIMFIRQIGLIGYTVNDGGFGK
jgi:hypothetical protein